MGDMTQVQCLVGFEPEGDMTSHCLEGGTWSRPGGSCRRNNPVVVFYNESSG